MIKVYKRTNNGWSCKVSGDTYQHKEVLKKYRFIWLGNEWDSTLLVKNEADWTRILNKEGVK